MTKYRYIKKKSLYLFLVNLFIILPHFKTPYMDQIGSVDMVFNLWRVISAIYIILKVLKKPKISSLVFLFIIFQAIYLFSTVFNAGNIRECILATASILSLSMYLDMTLNSEDYEITLEVLRLIFELLVYINLITVITIPDGMYKDWTWRNWFLGTDNQHVIYYIVGSTVSIICSWRKQRYFRTVIFLLAAYITTFITFSGTAVGGMVVYALLIILLTLFLRNTKIPFSIFFAFPITIFLMVVVLRVQDIFAVIITDWIGKDLTFTGRTFIWDRAIYWFTQSPIIGYGIEYSNLHTEKTIFPSTHNTILGYAYNGGLMALVTFSCIITIVGKQLSKLRSTYISKIISAAIAVLFFMMIFEEYKQNCLYTLYLLAYNLPNILQKEV